MKLDTLCAEQGPAYGNKQSGSKVAPSRVLLQPLPVVGTLQRAFAHVLAVGLVRSRSQPQKERHEGGLPCAGFWCVCCFALMWAAALIFFQTCKALCSSYAYAVVIEIVLHFRVQA